MGVEYNQGFNDVNTKTFSANYSQGCKTRPVFRGDRLAALLREKGLSQSALAQRVGVSQATIWKLISTPSQGSKHTHRIAAELGTTSEFLMDETDDPGASALAERLLPFRPVPVERDPDVVELSEIDLRFGLGATYVDSPAEVRKRRFSREWLRNFTNAAPEQLVWTVGTGDSMEPTIRSGEVILIDRSQQSPRFGDEIWACSFGDIGMIKRLRPMPDGTVQIHSDNQVVRPEVAADGELHVYGRVVAVVRKL